MTIKCYSQRLLNPFRGMLNIIEYNSAEAVTMDGITWDIYVRNIELVKDLEQNQNNCKRIQTSEIRYGRWSNKNGLQRGPTIDSEDFKYMAETGKILYQYLVQHHHEVPFTYQDNYELWLLDVNNQPLALLHSVVNPEDIEPDHNITWTAGIACKELFVSSIKLKSDSHQQTINHAEQLKNLINSHSNNSAQWLLRKEDGSGQGLEGINLDSTLTNRKVPACNFPIDLIKLTDFTHIEQDFIQDYFKWLAPYLLVLQSHSSQQRAILEQHACSNALLIEKQYQLYPVVINQKLIKSALVEAVLRKTQDQILMNNLDKVESVEYLELNNPTHHLNK